MITLEIKNFDNTVRMTFGSFYEASNFIAEYGNFFQDYTTLSVQKEVTYEPFTKEELKDADME